MRFLRANIFRIVAAALMVFGAMADKQSVTWGMFVSALLVMTVGRLVDAGILNIFSSERNDNDE